MKKVAIVSGGTGYVGSAIVKKLIADGFSVASLYNSPKIAKLNEYKCDLRNEDEVRKTIEKIEIDMGEIYACVHTAGTKPDRKQLHLSRTEDLKVQFETNVFGSFNFLSACALKMKKIGGVVIAITTEGVVNPKATKSLGAYIAAKYALQGMLNAFREELVSNSIRVYSIAPGFMEGGMNKDIPKAFVEMIKKNSPNGSIRQASDIAEIVSSLCKEKGQYHSESTIII